MSEQAAYEDDRPKYARIAGTTLLQLISSGGILWTEDERDFARILIKAHAFSEGEMLEGSFLESDVFEDPKSAPGELGPYLASRQEAFASYITSEGVNVCVTARRSLFAFIPGRSDRIFLSEQKLRQVTEALSAAHWTVNEVNFS